MISVYYGLNDATISAWKSDTRFYDKIIFVRVNRDSKEMTEMTVHHRHKFFRIINLIGLSCERVFKRSCFLSTLGWKKERKYSIKFEDVNQSNLIKQIVVGAMYRQEILGHQAEAPVSLQVLSTLINEFIRKQLAKAKPEIYRTCPIQTPMKSTHSSHVISKEEVELSTLNEAVAEMPEQSPKLPASPLPLNPLAQDVRKDVQEVEEHQESQSEPKSQLALLTLPEQDLVKEIRVEAETTVAIDSGTQGCQKKPVVTKLHNCWPAVGTLAGAALGAIANVTYHGSLFEKGGEVCNTSVPIFSTINGLKNVEIKSISLLTPAVLMAGSLLGNLSYKLVQREGREKNTIQKMGIFQHVAKEFGKLPFREMAASALLTYLTIQAKVALDGKDRDPLTKIRLDSCGTDLDPSGHILLKTAGLYGMKTAVGYINRPDQWKSLPLFMTALAVISVASDFPFMVNTAFCHHSVADIMTGGVAALMITTGVEAASLLSARAISVLKRS